MAVGGWTLDERPDLREDVLQSLRHRLADHVDLAAGGVDEAQQHADHRGLAGAVRAEQAEARPLRHDQIDSVDRGHPPVPLGQPARSDHLSSAEARVSRSALTKPASRYTFRAA